MKNVRYLSDGWTFCQSDRESPTGWLPATVPGHVHLDLMRHGIVADPFYRMQEAGCGWVDEGDWTYRTSFDWQPDPENPKRALVFEGLDTVCEVFLNGQALADHDNMFVPLEVDVTTALKPGANELEVRFVSAARVGRERRDSYLAQQWIDLDKGFGFAERSFVRKAQYMYGWDWGPCLQSCGIWQPVSLVEYAARVQDVWVTQAHLDDGSVKVSTKTTAERPSDVALYTVLIGPDGPIEEFDGDFETVIEEPELWWPHDLGEQPLYAVMAMLIGPDGAVLDSKLESFGLRELELIREKDEFGESFRFVVNGTPVWARGADWIPDHSFPSTVTPRQVHDQLQRARDLNMNMIRVWGGGLVESDAFYAAADELGILIWQDFCYACALYPDDEPAQKVARLETEAAVRRLRNRPSLAVWCGNNEIQWSFEEHVGKHPGAAQRIHGDNIFLGVIPQVLGELDPDRPYTPSSPWGRDDSLPQELRGAQKGSTMGGIGNQHNWDVWHGRGDWRYYTESRPRFTSEFGFASSPTLATWRSALAPEDESVDGPVVRWHDKTRKGYETYLGFTKLHYPEMATLEDLVYYTQLNQRDAMRHGVEHMRRSEYCKGALIWQLNDCWPVQSWALIDSKGLVKPAGWEVSRLFAPAMVSLERDGDAMHVHLVNDTPERLEELVRASAYSTLTGEMLREWEVEACVEPCSRAKVLTFSLKGLPTTQTAVFAGIADEPSSATWRFLAEPKEMKFASPATITVSTSGAEGCQLRCAAAVYDLVFVDADDPTNIRRQGDVQACGPLCFTSAEAATLELGAARPPRRVVARSLAGVHPVEFTRTPLSWPPVG